MRVLSSAYFTTSSVLFLALFVLNTFVWKNPWAGIILLIFFFIRYGSLVGKQLSPDEPSAHWWLGSFIILSCVSIFGSLAYYIWSMPAALFQILAILIIGFAHLKTKHHIKNPFRHVHKLFKIKEHKLPQATLISSAIILFLVFFILLYLGDHQIVDAVRSQWERMDSSLFLLMGLSLFLLFGLLMRGKEKSMVLVLVSVVLFAFVSVAAIAFPIGFGFDTFIHEATVTHIAEFGTISPKPFYYIGQYSIVLFLHHAFSLPLEIINTYLVPVLTALFLPSVWFFAAAHMLKKKQDAMATLMGLFLLPLSLFIISTPQALANLWILLTILMSIPILLGKPVLKRLWLIVPVLSALFIHPIAGIPIVLYVTLLFLHPEDQPTQWKQKAKTLFWLIAALAAIVLPLSFLVNSVLAGNGPSLDLSGFSFSSILNLNIFFENRFNPILDFVYLYGFNASLILFLIAGFAWFEYKKDLPQRFSITLIMAAALLVNFILMKTIVDFSFLIDYERLNYANRLVPLMIFFLVPYLLLGFGHFVMNIRSRPIAIKAFSIVLLATIGTSAFYLAYPRRDAYATSHGFNVGQADIKTVHEIENWSNNEPYLVLANQSVSAAAISEIDFRYYNNLFFYPIPTGGDLYQKFLSMNDHPTRDIAKEALKLVPMHGDVNMLYYVVNTYWWQAPRIIETAKTTANEWRSVDNVVFIFRYDF